MTERPVTVAQPYPGQRRQFRLRVRREGFPPVRPWAEQHDGQVLTLRYGWQIEDDDSRYPGEHAWVLDPRDDPGYPADIDEEAPMWIASGDLEAA